MEMEGLLKPWLPNHQKSNRDHVKLLEKSKSDCDFSSLPRVLLG